MAKMLRTKTDKQAKSTAKPITDSSQLDEFTTAFLECALWSSTWSIPEGDDMAEYREAYPDVANGDSCDTPLDDDFGIDDLDYTNTNVQSLLADCQAFQATHAQRIVGKLEDAGHDFWLTRNRHGAGFWDGDWPEADGKAMTDDSHAYGTVDLQPVKMSDGSFKVQA